MRRRSCASPYTQGCIDCGTCFSSLFDRTPWNTLEPIKWNPSEFDICDKYPAPRVARVLAGIFGKKGATLGAGSFVLIQRPVYA